MPRPRTVDPLQVVAAVKRLKRQSIVAREFEISRVRVNQILAEYAPELLKHRKPPETRELTPEELKNRARDKLDLERMLRAHRTRKEAAKAMGLTKSGLYSKMRRLGVEYKGP